MEVFRGTGREEARTSGRSRGGRPELLPAARKGHRVLGGEEKSKGGSQCSLGLDRDGSSHEINGQFRAGKGVIMEAKALKKKFSRSGCPSTHLLYRQDLADCCEFQFSNQTTGRICFSGQPGGSFHGISIAPPRSQAAGMGYLTAPFRVALV